MPVTMWAKAAAGRTNLGIATVQGFGKALRSWREVFQQTLWKRVAKYQTQTAKTQARERCLIQSTKLSRFTESLSGRVMRTFAYNNTASREMRRRMACKLSSSHVRNFRNIPLFSLISVSLGLDSANIIQDNTEKVLKDMKNLFSDYSWEAESLTFPPKSLQDLDMSGGTLASGCEGAVYKAKVKTQVVPGPENAIEVSDMDFDLAVKAVFNYGAASNADAILRELRREYVPLNMKDVSQNEILARHVGRLPPHPNIVDMPGVFEDEVLVTEEGLRKFPAALPRRVDPENCWGRNKTLYLVMRRRSTHLREYLATHEVSMATRCLLLAQLLEGVAHLNHHGIAHRDLKADNLLVDIPKDGGSPKLEICDFGCCLAEESRSLRVTFTSEDVNKGGNSWLMAPEIATAVPGPDNFLDYTKSDLWAVGAIAYEILGGENPFYPSRDPSQRQLSTWHYCEKDLPALPEDVPEPVQYLVCSMLSRDPSERPAVSVAAAVMQIVALEMSCLQSSTSHSLRDRLEDAGLYSKTSRPAAVAAVQRERSVFQWLLDQSQALLSELSVSCDQVWDVPHVMRFMFLSRLTHRDFRQACAFF